MPLPTFTPGDAASGNLLHAKTFGVLRESYLCNPRIAVAEIRSVKVAFPSGQLGEFYESPFDFLRKDLFKESLARLVFIFIVTD